MGWVGHFYFRTSLFSRGIASVVPDTRVFRRRKINALTQPVCNNKLGDNKNNPVNTYCERLDGRRRLTRRTRLEACSLFYFPWTRPVSHGENIR